MMEGSYVRMRVVRVLLAFALALLLALSAGCGVLNRGSEAGVSTKDGYGVTGSPAQSTETYDFSPNAEHSVVTEESAQRLLAPASGEDASTVPADMRLIVRTVDMRVEVDDVEASVATLRAAVDARKGIVTDLQVSTDEGVPIYRPYADGSTAYDGTALSGYMTVRVPADSLASFIEEVGDLGKVLRESENELDVTQQHIDLKARLTNLQSTEARLREFFDKAKNVTEMLSIEQELTRVRGEIEAMEAEIAYLERQAALSTVTVELVGPTPVVRPAGEDWGFVNALTQAVRAFVNTINVLIVVFGALSPVLLIGLGVFFLVRAIVRRRRANRPATAAEATDDEPVTQV